MDGFGDEEGWGTSLKGDTDKDEDGPRPASGCRPATTWPATVGVDGLACFEARRIGSDPRSPSSSRPLLFERTSSPEWLCSFRSAVSLEALYFADAKTAASLGVRSDKDGDR
jgi:hypothetical protein